MEYFKGDATEQKFYNAGKPAFDAIDTQQAAFLSGAFSTAPLGELIFDSGRSPLANAINRDIFRLSFKEIFDSFVYAGAAESYLTVFRKIFGNDVEVTFTVPAPGKLTIDIVAEGVELTNFVGRYIEDNQYLFDEMITQDGDNIAFQTIKGFESQYELEQMLFEMVPAGIFTDINLTLGV